MLVESGFGGLRGGSAVIRLFRVCSIVVSIFKLGLGGALRIFLASSFAAVECLMHQTTAHAMHIPLTEYMYNCNVPVTLVKCSGQLEPEPRKHPRITSPSGWMVSNSL